MTDGGEVPDPTDRVQRAEGVLALHDALAEGAGLPQLQQLAVQEVARHLRGAAALWFDDSEGLRLVCHDHPDPAASEDMAWLTRETVAGRHRFLAHVLEGRKPLLLTGEQVQASLALMERPYQEYFTRHGVVGMLLCPLTCQDRDVGVLGVSRDEGEPAFTPLDLEQVARMSRILSVALDNARALEQTREAVATSARLALTDPLTGLPNRRAFLEAEPAGDEWLGVLLLDVDDFKHVNDGFGHQAGDLVLTQFAQHLLELAGPGDLVTRIGGDEFAVHMSGAGEQALVDHARDFALAAVTRASLGDLRVAVRASCGLALTEPGAPREVPALLQQADLAMFRAKRERLGFAAYDPALDAAAAHRLRDLADLRLAVGDGGLAVHYQRCDPTTPDPSGLLRVEALVRWPRGGRLLTPASFLPLASEAGLMPDLTWEVVGQTLRQLATWRDLGVRAQASVNVPASVLVSDGFPGELVERVGAAGLGVESVVLEVTEEELVDEGARDAVRSCRALGLGVEIDDLGTGFSSLDSLVSVAATGAKLDRSLISGAGDDPRRRLLLGHLVELCHRLGMLVVAEGVETEADRDALVDLGVDYLQGYLLHRPSDAAGVLTTG